MAETSVSEGPVTGVSSIVADEVRRFAAQAGDWWDPRGSEAMLHKLNPVRLKYVRDQVDRHWQGDECSRMPLSGRTALDVGCGAGLLAEPLARLGAQVTGLDASTDLIAVALEHARASGLNIDYRAGELAQLEGQFDLITCMEVIEHVADPAAFVGALARRLAADGLLVLSTPNATGWSKLLMITVGEGTGRIPARHARFRQVHCAGQDEDPAERCGAQLGRRRRHRLVADPRAASQRRCPAELPRRRRSRLSFRLGSAR